MSAAWPGPLAVAALRRGLLIANPKAEVVGTRCRSPSDNLLPSLSLDEVRSDLEAGAGRELETKFLSPHSSSALAINNFAPFRSSGRPARLLGRDADITGFEVKRPTGLPRATPPHLDVMAISDTGSIAIESKCLEHLDRKRPSFSERYRSLSPRQRASRWYAEMERLIDRPADWAHLDTAQLIKHAFGLLNHSTDQPATLLYLFWEPRDAREFPVFARHREQVAEFAERIAGDEVAFSAMSYPELWAEWRAVEDRWLAEHLNALARYDVALT